MSLLSQNKKGSKKDKKSANANAAAASKINPKQNSAGVFAKKPMKTGGTRGS